MKKRCRLCIARNRGKDKGNCEPKRKQLDDKKVLDAYHSGNKTAEEIIEFILSDGQKQE